MSPRRKNVNGDHYLRVLEFVLAACPGNEGGAKLAHVVFIDDKVISADGCRWHVGHLPEGGGKFAPIAVARASLRELVTTLKYAKKMAALHGGAFFVYQDADEVVVQYGDTTLPTMELAKVNVGAIPDDWVEPVAADAPLVEGFQLKLRADHLKAAVAWTGGATVVVRGGEGVNDPIRIDVSDGDVIGSAFLLPIGRTPAQLAPDEPLFAKTNGGKPRGQSILDLQLDLKVPETPQTIKIGDVEFNVTGLGDPAELLRTGPCVHRETKDPCVPCTEVAVTQAKARAAEEAKKIVPLAKAKRKGKAPKGKGKPDGDRPQPGA